MDGRLSLAAPLVLCLFVTGCNTTGGAKNLGGIKPTETITKTTPTEPAPPPQIAQRAKDGPKRAPSAEFIVSLAAMSEEAAKKKKKTEPEQFIRSMDETRRLYQEALKVDPNYEKAQHGLIRAHTQLGEHHKAQDIVRAGLEKNPRDGRLWVELGMTYNRQKNYEEALKAFRKGLEVDPENRQYKQAMGFTLVWSGRLNEGMEYLTVALGKAGAHYNAAGILRQQNRLDEAKQHLQMCLDADRNFERAREMLAELRPAAPAPTTPGAEILPAGGLAPVAAPSVPDRGTPIAAPTIPAPSIPAPAPVARPAELPPALEFSPLQ